MKIEGDYPERGRLKTGLFSLDQSLRWVRPNGKISVGVPLRNIVILYGKRHCGKSSLAYYLAGRHRVDGTVSLCDIEGLDIDYLHYAFPQSGFDGVIRIIPEGTRKEPRMHHDMLNDMVDDLDTPEVSAAIFDSVSAYVPSTEHSGDVGEAFVGKRAKDMAQIARRATQRLRSAEEDKNLYIINHPYQRIGGHGHTIAGGDVMGNLAGTMIYMWRKDSQLIASRPDDHFMAEGKIEKNRYGGKGGSFKVVYLAGHGVHRGLTSIYDAMDLDIITKKKGGYMSLGDVSLGRFSSLIDAASAGEEDVFNPVYEALDKYEKEMT